MPTSEHYRRVLRQSYLNRDDVSFEEAILKALPESQTLTVEELTERFYLVRDQRNRLLWAAQKALDAFDAANATGKSTWSGKDVDELRMAVASARAIHQPRKYIGTAQPLTCANCGEVSTNLGQFTPDGRWLCTEACRKELCDKQSFNDLAASGGIVDAP